MNTITNPTKVNALRTFVRTIEADILFLQEVENEQLTLPGFNVIANVDEMRRGTAIALKEHIQFSHVEKSLDGRLVAVRVQDTTLCCVYAPSGTALRAQRERFFNDTIAYYLRHRTEHMILAGDFNCVLRQCDSTGTNMSPSLQATVQQLQLHDAWLKLRSRDAGRTYITANSASRLDRIYVSGGLCEQLRSVYTHACSFSDHMAVSLRICLPHLGREQGRGFWSLRPHLLTDDNIAELQIRWQFWTRQRRNYRSWMAWWLECGKPKIVSFFRWKSKQVFDEFHHAQQALHDRLRRAYDGYYQNPAMLTTINRLKGEMLALQRRFSQAFVRINEQLVAGEPLSVFQLGDRRRKRTAITRIDIEQDEVIDDSEAIQQHMHRYFSELYSERNREIDQQHDFQCDRIIPINDETNDACMDAITTADIWAAIKTSASRKSPGPDGLPKEFYHRTFDVIHRELNLILNEALASNFPSKFVDGVIVLVKKKGPGNTTSSYRPISLLNFDYKILSRILKLRLENVMSAHRILSDAQKCSNAQRNIFQATLALKDRIAQLTARKQVAKLVSYDLDHAFDRVRHSFLFSNMRSLGINPQLVELLSRISSQSFSRLLINGHMTTAFPIERSVRQGDPISMLLFVLYLHPLLTSLERVCGTDLIVAYADDISVIATSAGKIQAMHGLFVRFGRISGAVLNVNKTTSIDVGFVNGNPIQIDWLRTEGNIKILGVIYANSIRHMISLNWDAMVGKIAQLVWLHSLRSLTLHQKVILLNTFITAKVWYLSSIMAINCIHIAKITATMGSFLWRRQPARIPMQQLARPRDQGGLKLQLPALKAKALLINRHLQEIGSMPYYNSFLTQVNPNPSPTSLPCLKTILQAYPHLPPQIHQNPSSDQIHQFYINQTDRPRVEVRFPTVNWKRVWNNIASKKLTSAQRSSWYLLANEKIEHRQLWFKIRRVDSEQCLHCNAAVETLKHKLSECPRVTAAWTHLQRMLTTTLNGRRRLSFDDLVQPVLDNINRYKKIEILKLLINYVTFINTCDNAVDVNELEFYLNAEM